MQLSDIQENQHFLPCTLPSRRMSLSNLMIAAIFIAASHMPLSLLKTELKAEESCEECASAVYDFVRIVQTAFRQNLEIFQEFENTIIAYAANQKSLGQFDYLVNGSVYEQRRTMPQADITPFGVVTNPFLDIHEVQYGRGMQLGAQKTLLTGVTITPNVTIDRIQDNILVPHKQTIGHAWVVVEFPLIRGRGYQNVGADVISTNLQYSASLYNFRHQMARILAGLATSYWQYQFDVARIAVLEESVNKRQEFLEKLEIMIAAGEIAITELHQVKADLASTKNLLYQTEQDLYATKQLIKVLMNIDVQSDISIPLAQAPLPAKEETAQLSSDVTKAWIDEALDLRGDFLAAELSEQAASALVVRAQNALKPKLNLQVEVGMRGLSIREDYLNSLKANVRGPEVRTALVFERPICQNLERGDLYQRQAELIRAQASLYDLQNRIIAAIQTQASAIRTHTKNVEELSKAVDEQQKAVQDELFKLKEGISTVFSVIQTADLLLTAQLNKIQEEKSFINDLISLRFNMGIIVPIDDCCFELTEASFTSLPSLAIKAKRGGADAIP